MAAIKVRSHKNTGTVKSSTYSRLKGRGAQVFRKLSGLNKETRTLIEVFGMADNKILPEVDTEKFN